MKKKFIHSVPIAPQSLVSRSYPQSVATFSTNVLGTVHLLKALRPVHSARVVIVVTTDKVYRNPVLSSPKMNYLRSTATKISLNSR
ncbi:MAG: GDP-mannose 4,6-dehydratase [Cyanobacteriota bacterium]